MKIQKTYSSLFTADLTAAERWYTNLLGRGPDHRPMATLLHWELSDEGGLMLSSSEEIAARGAIFLYVDDLAGERRRLGGLGIILGDDNEGDYSTLAQVRDPDGNLITFASPPRRPFPPAYRADERDKQPVGPAWSMKRRKLTAGMKNVADGPPAADAL